MDASEIERVTVDDVYEPEPTEARLVESAMPLADAIEAFRYDPGLEALFVVDTRELLAGVVTRQDLLGWFEQALGSPQFQDRFPWAKLAPAAERATVEEACNPSSQNALVRPDEPIEHAARRMLQGGSVILPVVDAEGSVLGEISLLAVLDHIL